MAASPAAGESGRSGSAVGHGWTRQRLAVERAAASEGRVSFYVFSLVRHSPDSALIGDQAPNILMTNAYY